MATELREVHDVRAKADLAHAKSKQGKPRKPVSFRKRWLAKRATVLWTELAVAWKKRL